MRRRPRQHLPRATCHGLAVLCVWCGSVMSVRSPSPDAPAAMLALPGPLFPRIDFAPPTPECLASAAPDVEREAVRGKRFMILGTPMYLEDKPKVSSSSHTVKTSTSVWDCSLMLAKFVEKHEPEFRGKTVLELGSGQGVVGIATAMCGAHRVILTDVAPALPSIEHNIALNGVTAGARAVELDWFQPASHLAAVPPADVILAADVVWVEELVMPFVDTLALALKRSREATGGQAYALICHKTRSHHTDRMLLEGLAGHGLSVDVVPVSEHDVLWRSSELTLWRVV